MTIQKLKGYRATRWLVEHGGEIIGKFKTLKDAKEFCAKARECPKLTDQQIKKVTDILDDVDKD